MSSRRRRIISIYFGIAAILFCGYSIHQYILDSRPLTSQIIQHPNVRPSPPIIRDVGPTPLTDTQDAKLEATFSSGLRWTFLPDFLYALDRDATGHVWFSTEPTAKMYSLGDFRRSIENAAHHKSHIIRGGKILIVDSYGRYWGLSDTDQSILLCYDGSHWLEDHSSAITLPTTAPANDAQSRRPIRGVPFYQCALQMRCGDVCFVSWSGPRHPGGLHRYDSAGHWIYLAMPTEASFGISPAIVEQPGDRVTLCTAFRDPIGNSQDILKVRAERDAGKVPEPRQHLQPVVIFDRTSCTLYKPTDLPKQELWVYGVVALPDGSVITRYESGGPDVIAWPATLNQNLIDKAHQWLDQLDNPDADVRETATSNLLDLGPPALDLINNSIAQSNPTATPERKIRLHTIANLLKSQPTGDASTDDVLIGGRYHVKDLAVLTRIFDGRVRLYVEQCEDRISNIPLGPCFLTISSDGAWHVQELPVQDHDKYWIPAALNRPYEDVTGALWVHTPGNDFSWNDYVIEPDLSTHPAGASGFRTEYIEGSDLNGLMYFRTPNGWVRLDRAIPETPGDLPLTKVAADYMSWLPGEPNAWARHGAPMQIRPDGSLQPIPTPHNIAASHLFPLLNGAVIAWLHLRIADQIEFAQPVLWDGKQWISDQQQLDIRDFVRAHTTELMPLAPRTCAAFDDQEPHLWRLGSDRGKGLWLQTWHQDYDDVKQIYIDHVRMEYFDGTQWQDVWQLLPAPPSATNPDPDYPSPPAIFSQPQYRNHVLGTIDDGHTLLVLSSTLHKLFGISCDDGSLHRREISGLDALKGAADQKIESPQHRVWLSNGTFKKGYLAELRNDQLSSLPYAGIPTLADSKNRLWCRGVDKITVLTDQGSFSVPVPSLYEKATIIESPDSRIWLLNSTALSQLSLSPTSLSITGHWNWPSPRNFFEPFCDTAGGLWLNGVGGEIARIQLPSPNPTQ